MISRPAIFFVEISAQGTPADTILYLKFQKFPGGETPNPRGGRGSLLATVPIPCP